MTTAGTGARRKILKAVGGTFPLNAVRRRALGAAGYVIGEGVYIGEGLHVTDDLASPLAAGLRIGDRASVAQRVMVVLSSHPNNSELRRHLGVRTAAVEIGHDAWIGAAAILLPGVTVGHHAVVGAGAVVTRDVEPWTVVAGNPARPIRRLEE